MSLAERVEMILVQPADGGNVGACARALKNMGFASFSMVDPRYEDRAQARKMAVHAGDVLEAVRVYQTLDQAVLEANWVVGTSARVRANPERKPPIGPDEFVRRLEEMPAGSRAAVLFGPERTGLTRGQLGRCQDVLTLPVAGDYPSLNLAQAVLLVAWEIRRAGPALPTPPARQAAVTAGEIDDLLGHMRRTLENIDYLNPQNPELILDDLRLILSRAALDPRELAMLRGVFHKMDVFIAIHGGPPVPKRAHFRER